jgi:hypothetical protein
MQPTRITAIIVVLLTVTFMTGAVLYAANRDARDEQTRRTGVLIMMAASVLFMIRLAVAESLGAFRT